MPASVYFLLLSSEKKEEKDYEIKEGEKKQCCHLGSSANACEMVESKRERESD